MKDPSVDAFLASARERGALSSLDYQFASRLGALYGEPRSEVLWGLALACRQESHGHVCADLERIALEGLASEYEGEVRLHPGLPDDRDLSGWLGALRSSPAIEGPEASGAAQAPEASNEPRPLVLDERGRLYLRRSFEDERMLAEAISERASRPDLRLDWAWASESIERLSPTPAPDPRSGGAAEMDTDWAREALRVGLARPLSIVTGGPGTGKTTMVVRLIALLIEQALEEQARVPSVRLLAPTGKAAAAMTASFGRQQGDLDVSPATRLALPMVAETIHRALLPQTRRDALGRPAAFSLDADVVVVDEASMVDLGLLRRLFSACQGVGRIVLLGDPDQLASVDSGAVLSELCGLAEPSPRPLDWAARAVEATRSDSPEGSISDSIVTLRVSHRFASGGGIGRLAEAVRKGDTEEALALLDDPEHPEIERLEVDSVAATRGRLVEAAAGIQREIAAAGEPGAKLDRLMGHRVLCAHRRGPLGVEALCEILDAAAAETRQTTSRSGWWRGRILLVTRNAPEQDLWNGDVGLVEETGEGLRALFPDSTGGVRALSAGRLPSHESAIAMSVHKSQGSEFDDVDLVLAAAASRLMTRELLYTGITRARRNLRIHASVEAIRDAIGRRVQRDSGLSDRLRERR